MQNKPIVIDANNMILGRLAAKVAKMLLEGKRVIIVNAEKAVISGEPSMVIQRYKDLSEIKSRRNPRRGPFFYSRPDLFVKRRIRGMLPYKKSKGKLAFRRLKVYIGVPPEYEKIEKVVFKEFDATKRLRYKWISVGEIAKKFGWSGKTEWKKIKV